MICGICNEKEAKYKCPKCSVSYCSLVCFKSEKHKEMDTTIIEKMDKVDDNNDNKRIDNNNSNNSNNDNNQLEENDEVSRKNLIEESTVEEIDDPMFKLLLKEPQFQEYISSPVLQFHILTIFEILDNVSLTNEYSKEGRIQIASRKLNNLRNDGVEANVYVEEFINWLLNWIENYKECNV